MQGSHENEGLCSIWNYALHVNELSIFRTTHNFMSNIKGLLVKFTGHTITKALQAPAKHISLRGLILVRYDQKYDIFQNP